MKIHRRAIVIRLRGDIVDSEVVRDNYIVPNNPNLSSIAPPEHHLHRSLRIYYFLHLFKTCFTANHHRLFETIASYIYFITTLFARHIIFSKCFDAAESIQYTNTNNSNNNNRRLTISVV